MADDVLFRERDITVTKTIVTMGDKTYSMANVTSVGTEEVEKPSIGCPVALIVVGCIIGFIAISLNASGLTIAILGGVPLAIGILLLMAFKGAPPEYAIRIASASAEQEVLRSADRAFVERVSGAIVEAIKLRG